MKKQHRKKRVEETAHDIEAKGLPSASSFDANFRCLGRRELCAQLPREEDSAAAARGTRIHKALETSDLSELSKSDEVTASRCFYAEAELCHNNDFEGAEVAWEERVWDVDDDLEPVWSARVDALYLQKDKRRAMVNDHKTGWGLPVPIEHNWQIRAQTALVAEQHGLHEVVGALVHPHHPDSLYEVAVYKRDELDLNLQTVRGFVEMIQQSGHPRTPNPISCQFCAAKRVCPEFQKQQADLMAAVEDEKEDRGFTAIIRRTPKERGAHVGQLKMLQKSIVEMLEQYAVMVERDPEAVAGYGLRRKYDRKITDEDRAIVLLEEAFGRGAAQAALTFSLGAVEEHLAGKLGKRQAKVEVERVLHQVLAFKPSRSWIDERRLS